MPSHPQPLSQLAALSLPKPGQRVDLPQLAGSADALALSHLHRPGQLLMVIAASPLDAQRLLEEAQWFAPGLRVHLLPDWETLPYDGFSPHQDLISERLATLYAVTQNECDVLITSAATALTRLGPPSYLAAHTFFIKKGDKLKLDQLKEQLTVAGYAHVTQVVAAGEYSVRGGIVDLFPMGTVLPYRIDLFDDEVETLRVFDVDTQRTLYPVPEIRLLPAREFPLGELGRNKFRQRFRETFEGDASRVALYKDVSNGTLPGGIEYYLPLFFDTTGTLFDFLPKNTALLLHRDVPGAVAEFWTDTKSRFKLLGGDRSRPILPPEELFLSDEQFFSATHAYPTLRMGAAADASRGVDAAPLPVVAVDRKADQPLTALQWFLDNFKGRVLLLAESAGRRETITEYLNEYGLKPVACGDFAAFIEGEAVFMLGVGPVSGGFMLPPGANVGAGFAIITENELYAATARPRHKRESARRANLEGWLRDLSELKIGDPVVHESHGIGRYKGLVHMDYGAGNEEFLHLEYAEGATLYVPVAQLHVISRYSGVDPEAIELHRLGSGQWEKAKRKAAEQVRDTAAELLHLYAQRAARKGHQFDFKQHDLEAFADGFGFEETPDQQTAINAVVEDMKSGKPMDRLVCGDVGFGKTEVALRAAFVAVAGGKQVAVLCPTTLLAEQHFPDLLRPLCRLAGEGGGDLALPFRQGADRGDQAARRRQDRRAGRHPSPAAEGRGVLAPGPGDHRRRTPLRRAPEGGAEGAARRGGHPHPDRHADPAHAGHEPGRPARFLGDRHAAAEAAGHQDLRHALVQGHQVREACLREFKRGGQVYFLHNEVDTIENMKERLHELMPEARIVVGHGQLPERELERVMREFTQQKHNVLLCSTIIETGIDNPHANTIIINRADKFGLAQLHQLRGRVGRSPPPGLRLPAHRRERQAQRPGAEAGWRRSRRWKSWAPASSSPCTIWKSAAPARCWATTSPARSTKSASPCTPTC
jgi:transcription-repair coupling factor (superfamily II helicase)